MSNEKRGGLRLELVDVYGSRLKEKVDLSLRHMTLGDVRVAKGLDASKRILVSGLHQRPQGLYRLEIDPPSFLPVSRFVNIAASGVTALRISFPVDPKKILGVHFPAYSALSKDLRALLERSRNTFSLEGITGKALYESLDDIRRAGLLNLAAKAGATTLIVGRTVLSYVQELRELRGDRFFAVSRKEMREDTKNSATAGILDLVSGALHHLPALFGAFTEAGSFKTDDLYGNLQLTFFMNDDETVVDMDIDDARGLEHVFQVLRNTLKGRLTHPYDIHEILVLHQQLDPGYRFQVWQQT